MSHGLNVREHAVSRLRHASRGNKGFSLVELMMVSLIVVSVFGALFMTLIAGDSSIAVNSEKIDVQARTRVVMDRIIRDLRGAISWEINANNPNAGYVKLNLWDWDAVNNTWKLGNQFVEYSYDSVSRSLTRKLVDAGGTVYEEASFPGIMLAPFYTSYVDEYSNQFDRNDLLAQRKIVVVVRAQSAARGRDVSYTLVEEVKIRNG